MKTKQLFILPIASGLISLGLACAVLFGWYTHNEALVQVLPHFAPMQYNTALGFLLSGMALIALGINQTKTVIMLGILTSFLGGLTLIQYMFGFDFGIDEVFMESYITVKTSHPGRMAPNTALCFLLCGIFFALSHHKKSLKISISIGLIVLSIIALSGYIFNVENSYGWRNLTRMALHTASSFLVLGFGMLAFCLASKDQKKLSFWQASPLTFSTVLIILTLLSWQGITEITDARNKEYFNQLVADTEKALKKRYTLYEQSLLSGQGVFYASYSVEREEWKIYVNSINIETTLPGINGLGYIDYVQEADLKTYLEKTRQDNAPNFVNHPETPYKDKFIIKFIEPAKTNKPAIGLDIGFEKNRREAAEYSRDHGVPTLTKKIELVQDNQKQAGFLLLLPIYDQKSIPKTVEERRSFLKGWVYAPFIGSHFLRSLSDVSRKELNFSIYDGESLTPDALIFSTSSEPNTLLSPTLRTSQTTIGLGSHIWSIAWQESNKFDPPGNQSMATTVLSFGILFSMLLYFSLRHLLRSKEIISKEVTKRTAELALTLKDLKQANDELEKFAYIASHDLKAPLRNIDNLATWISEDLKDVMNEETQERMNLLQSRVKRLESMLKDILEYSRAGKVIENPQNIDLNETLRTLVDGLDIPKGFQVNLPSDMPNIFSPRTPLEQIFSNIIGNAIKHHDHDQGQINITWQDTPDTIEFYVQDDGPGIPKEFQEKVFEMFQTLQPRDTTEGSGLGMSIIKKLIEWQDGNVYIKSENGKRGTTIVFTWPKTYRETRNEDDKQANERAFG